MNPIEGSTDGTHSGTVDCEARAWFSKVVVVPREEVLLCVEASWVHDGARARLTISRLDGEGGRAEVDEIEESMHGERIERSWRAELPPSQLDSLPEPIFLEFTVRFYDYSLVATSQRLVLQRPRFST